MNTEQVLIADVTVPAHRARGLNAEAVKRLAESIDTLGLQTPITVRYDEASDEIRLVAGLHRLKACEQLGHDKIQAIYTKATPEQARMWEIAENLFRAELSAVERAEHIDEWRKLASAAADYLPRAGGARATNQGMRWAARELGVSHTAIQDAAKIAKLPPEVKKQAIAERWTQARALAAATGKPAPAVKNAFESEEDWRRALFTVWNRGAQDWRERALEAMDRPVFDRTDAA